MAETAKERRFQLSFVKLFGRKTPVSLGTESWKKGENSQRTDEIILPQSGEKWSPGRGARSGEKVA